MKVGRPAWSISAGLLRNADPSQDAEKGFQLRSQSRISLRGTSEGTPQSPHSLRPSGRDGVLARLGMEGVTGHFEHPVAVLLFTWLIDIGWCFVNNGNIVWTELSLKISRSRKPAK